MAVSYPGIVKGNTVELPPDVKLPEGAAVTVVVAAEDAAWLDLAESTFAADWDNELDAEYDNWEQRYGVSR